MRTPHEAVSIVLDRCVPTGRTERVPLAVACGRVLAGEVRSDLDLPPFRRSAMDGFAVRSADFVGAPQGGIALQEIGEARAGEPFAGALGPGQCTAIYTGAEVPVGADAVVMVERSRRAEGRVVLDDRPAPGQHVCERGEDLAEGEPVLPRGRRLRPADLSALAAVGADPLEVFRRPSVVVLTTGDELVPPSTRPGPGQIREGNTLHLAALARAAGAEVLRTGMLRDDPALLRAAFERALEEADVLLTTGGVSMGEYDLVGDALAAAGVEPVFHKVAIKPGKPVWFGVRGTTLVFGLPGNPVSCLVGHEVFVRPALMRLGGAEEELRAPLPRGRWAAPPSTPNPREQHLPVEVRPAPDGAVELAPVRWKSSGDVIALTRAQGLAVVEAGASVARGDLVPYRPLT